MKVQLKKSVTPPKPVGVTKEKWAAITDLMKSANKSLGAAGRIFLGSEYPAYDRIPTGILTIDTLLGGGIPRRRLLELSGEDSSGKTLVALEAVKAFQRAGEVVVWVAGEEFDKAWAKRRGVDLDKLLLVEGDAGDKMCETSCTLIESQLVGLCVFDAYQSLGTDRELEGGVESESYGGGGAPQMWGRVKRRILRSYANKANTAIIGISEVRAPIGKTSGGYGPPEPESTGIKVLRHWRATALRMKKGEPFFLDPNNVDKKSMYARQFKVKCTKNKTAPTVERSGSFHFYFRSHEGVPFGVDRVEETVRLAKAYDIIVPKGSWIEAFGIRVQGEKLFTQRLRDNQVLVEKIAQEVMTAAGRVD